MQQITNPIDEAVRTDPHECQSLIKSIQTVYYSAGLEVPRHELDKLSTTEIELAALEKDSKLKSRQLSAINKRFADLVMENYMSYEKELEKVTELDRCLRESLSTCVSCRRNMAMSKQRFTSASVQLVRNHRKRIFLVSLLQHLRIIATLHQSESRLKALLDAGEYADAVKLLVESRSAAEQFGHYLCIRELSSKLEATCFHIEEHIKSTVLSQFCYRFSADEYENVYTAFSLLGKAHVAVDELLMCFSAAVYQSAFGVVSNYISLFQSGSLTAPTGAGAGDDGAVQKVTTPFQDLCLQLNSDGFLQCLVDVCKAVWQVLCCYLRIVGWHRSRGHVDLSTDWTNTGRTGSLSEEDSAAGGRGSVDGDKYVGSKLVYGLGRLWSIDFLSKVKTLIKTCNFSCMRYEEFIKILDIISRLMSLGSRHFLRDPSDLSQFMREQTLQYFEELHKQTLEELGMFLENESWQVCPVKAGFTVMQLAEFQFLQNTFGLNVLNDFDRFNTSSEQSSELATPTGECSFPYDGSFEENPFDFGSYETKSHDESFMEMNGADDAASSSEDEDRSSARLYGRRHTLVAQQTVVACNATLQVLRYFGKYVQMLNFLRSIISYEVVLYMTQLFDYYIYTIVNWLTLGHDDPSTGFPVELMEVYFSNRLTSALRRINTLVMGQSTCHQINGALLSSSRSSLDRFAVRCVAVESIQFLADHFASLYPYLSTVIPRGKQAFLQQFRAQTLDLMPDVRLVCYYPSAAGAYNADLIIRLIGQVRWDMKELGDQEQSAYVSEMVQNVMDFTRPIVANQSTTFLIPDVAKKVLFENLVRVANHLFVDGFGSVRKCSTQGRGQMHVDYMQFLKQIERPTGLKTNQMPDTDFVTKYIQAYYLQEEQMVSFVRENTGRYSVKQRQNLIGCVPHISRKVKSQLNSFLETDPADSRRSSRSPIVVKLANNAS